MKDQWNVEDIAAAWGLSTRAVYALLARGRIPAATRTIEHGIAVWRIPAGTPKPVKLKTGPKPK